ncbi:DUF1801 domain-containing protein [Zhouia sp. PK063]|uniref:DUF1801 domain-containing protein n=1 Tax=Zhouia sp. PK063 TaxID=3373602 RepID=UPI0037BC9ACA
MSKLNSEVSTFLDELHHPFRVEIEALRHIILNAVDGLSEHIKWNGPNYSYKTADRITLKIQPPKQLHLIFHCGAKKQAALTKRVIDTPSKILLWKDHQRAVATFKSLEEITTVQAELTIIVKQWIKATT